MNMRFDAEIWFWRGPAPFFFVTVPEPISADIRHVAGEPVHAGRALLAAALPFCHCLLELVVGQ